MGVLTTHIARHVEALPHIARSHVYRIGDGGAHLHVWFFARPERSGADARLASYGGARTPVVYA
jgi:hypothetical protein